MEPDRWQRINDLFQSALDSNPEDRSAFLQTACEGDEALRHEIESLLAAHQQDHEFTDARGFEHGVRLLEQTQGQNEWRMGPYRVLREIGRGGMGSVYLAARADDEFQKRVAIKIIRRGLDTDDILQRFRSERQILATLDHPNIARLLDGGTTDDGRPFFVMELIEGEPIDQYCDRRNLTIADRLKLFQDVCAAVQYSHQNLVIHRDIKPGNILVTKEGVPRLLDFGIAKLVAPGTGPNRTMTTLRPLTPEYASPEQLRGEPVTTASDVYSLGVLLFVLLTGRSPYRGVLEAPAEIERAINEQEPNRPSTVAPARIRRHLEGDLDNIVLMALRKEPNRRYASVERFSEDIRRHLGNLPVIARRDTRAYRTSKFVLRNKGLVAAVTIVFLTLSGGIVATLWEARVARRQRDIARVEQAKATRINAFTQEMISYAANTTPGSPKRAKGHDATVVDMLDEAAERVDRELSDQPEVRAEMLGNIGVDYIVLGKVDSARRFLREAYDLDIKMFSPDDMRTAAVMYGLANLSYLSGDYADAETRIRQALPVYRKHASDPGFKLPKLTAVLSDAAFIMRARGHLDEAESLWREVIRYGPRQPPEGRSAQTMVKSYLAQLYMDRGDIERADEMATAAASEARALGNPFAMTQTLIDLGNVRRFERRYGEAESLIEEGTKLFAQAQGDDHPNVVFGLTQLVYAYYYEGRYDRAEQEARKAFAMAQKLPKSSHYYRGAEVALGRVLNRTGRSLEAEPLLREALAVHEGTVPRRSSTMAFTLLGSLGECLATEKRYAEAEPLLKESYETLTALQVPQSPMLDEARQRLVSLYNDWGKPQAADRYRREPGR